jgi:hypothetical protein
VNRIRDALHLNIMGKIQTVKGRRKRRRAAHSLSDRPPGHNIETAGRVE